MDIKIDGTVTVYQYQAPTSQGKVHFRRDCPHVKDHWSAYNKHSYFFKDKVHWTYIKNRLETKHGGSLCKKCIRLHNEAFIRLIQQNN